MKEAKKDIKVSIFNLQSNAYVRWHGGNATLLTKKDSKRVSHRPFGYVSNEILDEELYLLATHGLGYWENY